jgi:hypothetical protein
MIQPGESGRVGLSPGSSRSVSSSEASDALPTCCSHCSRSSSKIASRLQHRAAAVGDADSRATIRRVRLTRHIAALLAEWAHPLMTGTPDAVTDQDVNKFVRTYARPNAWRGTEGLCQAVFAYNGATKAPRFSSSPDE